MLVLAGPGSGKTSVLISHIQQLITNGHARPEEILVVTFTRAAAKEMRDRFLKNSGASSTRVTFGTLHGVFYAILRGTKKTLDKRLVAGEEKRRILYTLLDDLGQDRQQRKEQAELLEKEFSQVKKCGDLEHFEPESLDKEQFVQAFTAYNGMLVRENGMDFDDLAPAVHKLLIEDENVRKYWQSRFSFVLVDEFQDIDMEQYELLKLISAPQNNLFLVGDDDQSIYGFRGAAPEVMQRVPVDFPELSKVVLDVNYRCKSRIIDHAGKLIGHNRVRFDKAASPFHREPGTVQGISAGDKKKEWEYLADMIREDIRSGRRAEQIAVLTRTHAGMRGIQLTLWKAGICCDKDAGMQKLSEHFIWKDVLAYLRLAAGTKDRRYYLAVLNRPSRFLRREDFPEATVNWQHCFDALREDPMEEARLRRFQQEIQMLQGLVPLAALYYVRYHLGYEEYLAELAKKQHRDEQELMAVLDILQRLAAGKQSMQDYIHAVEEYVWPVSETGVRVCTMHGSKGLEYDVVYIPDVNEGNIPWHEARTEAAVEEERRLLYVGMTRAREKLCFLWIDDTKGNIVSPSRFLSEAGLIRSEPAYSKDKR